MPVRAVFDTNIWIAGLIWRGGPYRCLMLARVGAVQLVYCPAMTAELTEKLRTKFKYSEHDIRAVVYELNRIATRVDISGQLKVVLADPDDDKFIECAVVANAEIVVSEDKHLLELGQYQKARPTGAAAFRRAATRRPSPRRAPGRRRAGFHGCTSSWGRAAFDSNRG